MSRVGRVIFNALFHSPLTIALAGYGFVSLIIDIESGEFFSGPTHVSAEVEWASYAIAAFFLAWMALLLWQGRKLMRTLQRTADNQDDADIAECRIDPADGNAYFVRSMDPIVPGLLERGFKLTLNDVEGGHERVIDADEWVGWERA